jgi:hypothetical protein
MKNEKLTIRNSDSTLHLKHKNHRGDKLLLICIEESDRTAETIIKNSNIKFLFEYLKDIIDE